MVYLCMLILNSSYISKLTLAVAVDSISEMTVTLTLNRVEFITFTRRVCINHTSRLTDNE